MATRSARTPTTDKPSQPTISVAIVVNDDGTTAEHVIRPIHEYQVGEYLSDEEIIGGRKSLVIASWLAAGKPTEDPMEWFSSLLSWNLAERPIPPTNGSRRKA